jgi:hypothetical protein
VSARSLLDALEAAYGDTAARLAAIDPLRVLAEVERRGRIPPAESMKLLACYTRNEVAEVIARIQAVISDDATAPRWIEGIGLCSAGWCEKVLAQVRDAVAASAGGRLPLAALRERVLALEPALGELAEAPVEALAHLAGLHVSRASIFEVEVRLASAGAEPEAPRLPTTQVRKAQPRSAPRRKHRDASYTTSSVFPAERASDDSAGPGTASPTTS